MCLVDDSTSNLAGMRNPFVCVCVDICSAEIRGSTRYRQPTFEGTAWIAIQPYFREQVHSYYEWNNQLSLRSV